MKATGIVKLLIITVNTILVFLVWPPEPEGLWTSSTIPFVFMSLVIPCYHLGVRKEKRERLKWPDWNVDLFNPKGATLFGNYDFFGVSFAAVGLSMLLSNKINYDVVSQAGLTSVSFGLGILSGLLATIVIGRNIQRES